MKRSAESRPAAVFMADDDADMREVVRCALMADGYRVTEAADGQELLDRIAAGAATGDPPALVIADVAMPRMSGPEVAQATRARGLDVPFVFMTAFVSAGGYEAARAAGGVAIFDKPFDMDDMLKVVREHVG